MPSPLIQTRAPATWFTGSWLKNRSLCHSLEQLSRAGLACFDFKVSYKTYINKEVLCEKSIHVCFSGAFCLQLRAWKGGKTTTQGMIWVEFYYMCCCVCMCLLSLSKFTPHNSLKTGGYIVGQCYAHAFSCEHEVNAIMHSTAIPRGWRESCQRF